MSRPLRAFEAGGGEVRHRMQWGEGEGDRRDWVETSFILGSVRLPPREKIMIKRARVVVLSSASTSSAL
jgi:hypothetical protein